MTTIPNLMPDLELAQKMTRDHAIKLAKLVQLIDRAHRYEAMGLADTNDAVIEVYDNDDDLLGYL